MKTKKSISSKNKIQAESTKAFKPLTNQQLESIIGGPVTSRGTESVVQPG